MAWSSPATASTGVTVPASFWNTNGRDNLNYLHSPPACLATRTAALSITTATFTNISFNGTDIYDTDTMHDPVTNNTRITINTAGVYHVWGATEFAANATGLRRTALVLNAAQKLAGAYEGTPGGAQNGILEAHAVYKFAATDFVELYVYQSSGAGLNILGTGNTGSDIDGIGPPCYFGAQWVGDGT